MKARLLVLVVAVAVLLWSLLREPERGTRPSPREPPAERTEAYLESHRT